MKVLKPNHPAWNYASNLSAKLTVGVITLVNTAPAEVVNALNKSRISFWLTLISFIIITVAQFTTKKDETN